MECRNAGPNEENAPGLDGSRTAPGTTPTRTPPTTSMPAPTSTPNLAPTSTPNLAPTSTPNLALTPKPTPAAWVLLGLIHLYRHTLGVLIPPSCRFAPSCSTYALEAVRQYGALRGAWLSAKRLARCHPFHPGGWDPVIRVRDGGLR